MNLRTKTFLLVSGIASVIIVLVTGAALHFQEQTVRAHIFAGVDAVARTSSITIATFLRDSQRDATLIASELPRGVISDKSRRAELNAYLHRAARNMPRFDSGVFLLDREGRFLADYPPHPELKGQSFAYRNYFKQAASTLQPAAGEPYISTRTKLPVQTFAVPIVDSDGTLLAVLGCSVNLFSQDGIGSIVFQKFGESGYIYTFDRVSRLMITHPENARMLQRDVLPGANHLLDKAVAGFEGAGETINSRGVPMLMGVRAVHGSTWLVAVQMPQTEAFAPLRRTRLGIAGIAAGAWLLAVVLSLWAAGRISRPIKRLHADAVAISERLPSAEAAPCEASPPPTTHPTSGDEIGDLAHAFANLAQRLDDKVSSLQEAAHEVQTAFDAVAIPLFRLDMELRVARCNRVAIDWLRRPEAELIGQPLNDLLFPDGQLPSTWPDLADPSTMDVRHERHWMAGLPKSGRQHEFTATWIADDDNQASGLVVAVRDVTERLCEAERMRMLAFHDPLTGLPNRLLLADRLQQALTLAQREGRRIGLMFLDLDRFKPVNDNYGHDVGDALLKGVAARVLTCLRGSDTLARVGGDEFVVVLSNLASPDDARVIAERIIASLASPFELAAARIKTATSIGIAIYPDHGADAETLTTRADTAMYEAKRQGRHCYVFASGESDTSPPTAVSPDHG